MKLYVERFGGDYLMWARDPKGRWLPLAFTGLEEARSFSQRAEATLTYILSSSDLEGGGR